ncbi:MAG: hypothetical protein A2X08_04030 [Bacteroidetes bacterium GWA2_32_17]|nr:MAG: hypothetical protein A2X08_04030 [Bacteroidetes bacterium GWA2_32_17]
MLYYEGEVNHEITLALAAITEKHLAENFEKRIIQKKVFNVMIECLQNIDKHTFKLNKDNHSIRKGAILVSDFNDSYSITSGNTVTQKQMNELTSNINNLQYKKKEELRGLYKVQLENGRLSEKGGAGLGFIDIARKTENSLNFSFVSLKNKLYFFVLKIIIYKNK